VLGHEVLNELDVGIAWSLHARALPTLFLCTRMHTNTQHYRGVGTGPADPPAAGPII